jgi:hypothetical protein
VFPQCGILELFPQCGILELFPQCGIFCFSFYYKKRLKILITGFISRLTRREPQVEQGLLTLTEHRSSPPVFSRVRVTQSLVLYVCFVDRCFLDLFPQCGILELFPVWYFRSVPTVWYFRTVPTVCYFRTVPTACYFRTVPTACYFRTVPTVCYFRDVLTYCFQIPEYLFMVVLCQLSIRIRLLSLLLIFI